MALFFTEFKTTNVTVFIGAVPRTIRPADTLTRRLEPAQNKGN
ncbi:hypothetical protein DAQ1742_03376 [Dickeya aquatica]|uniref:Uncharacterized protein n=1 Tax=Dickeya aquatica TaxID=1401087 RepID=A0A375ADS5_9GAMM|nr:hypothetical protein DAQ1742_03376 [Dickeya aquatica]